ncbi:metabolite traffic protein EboE [Crenalkalicoccus roseus]|uniref:metabolite traffic protein EboE n=1 Tax=Crenalkalicoccus roseus TaxID=1485588 RepID=UPI001081A2D7|nr:metabolite traffic protein EboE [Crenalkalicoccus roseus]
MRAGPGGEFHLTYCTNIHPGESWDEVRASLERHLPPLKAQLSPRAPFGVGLRLSARAAAELEAEAGALDRLAAWLEAEGLYVFTINGFPHGGFHRTVVKDQVYAPDWTRAERLDYTLRLARILARLLPAGMEGGISTVPLSYKRWHPSEAAREEVRRAASLRLATAAAALSRLAEETGRLIHLDIEPEPDCLIEDAEETVAFFGGPLLRHGAPALGLPRGTAEERLRVHLRVCWDACHAAVEYEAPEAVLRRFEAAGIGVGKLQVSAALKATLGDAAARRALAERLRPFAESTYLHQVVERRGDGGLRRHPDLDIALGRIADPEAREWRVHFHVPVFAADCGGLDTTRAELEETLALLRRRPFCSHLEIETYTWEVLPPAQRLDLAQSIRREFDWVLGVLGRPGAAA